MPRILLPGRLLADGTALRPWRPDDLEAVVAACQDPEIPRWTRVPREYGEAEGRAFLDTRPGAAAAGESASFAIADALDERRILGSVSLMGFSWPNARAEVGYWVAREARGRGHCTRAVRLITEWGFTELRLERIELMAATGNLPSRRVAERAGYTREATLRSYMRTGNHERLDMLVFSRLAGE